MVFLAIVTSNGLPYAVRLLYVLSVCNVGVLWSNGWMDQDATWYTEIGLSLGDIVLDADPASPLPTERSTAASQLFAPLLLWPNGPPSYQRHLTQYTFDTVIHLLWLNSTLDIPPAILNWIVHFLTGRTQVTKISDSTLCGFHPITQSILQGSGIGPTLWIIME